MERDSGKSGLPVGKQVVDRIYSWAHSGRKLFDVFDSPSGLNSTGILLDGRELLAPVVVVVHLDRGFG